MHHEMLKRVQHDIVFYVQFLCHPELRIFGRVKRSVTRKLEWDVTPTTTRIIQE